MKTTLRLAILLAVVVYAYKHAELLLNIGYYVARALYDEPDPSEEEVPD